MGCGACGPTRDVGTERMYKELEKTVLAQEEEKKQAERDRRISLGLPAEEGEIIPPARISITARGRSCSCAVPPAMDSVGKS